jgi:excisionase family DNA binding protein
MTLNLRPSIELLTTEQVAAELGVSRRRVQALITAGRLPATRYGHVLLVHRRHLTGVRDRKPGRPRTSVRQKNPKKISGRA